MDTTEAPEGVEIYVAEKFASETVKKSSVEP
jgi:hypothetical protein